MKTKFKIFFSVTLLAVAFIAVPKIRTYVLPGYDAGQVQSTSEIISDESLENKDCNFEKFDTPAYYTVFKLILNFLPLKEPKQTSFNYKHDSILKDQNLIPTLKNKSIA